MNELRSNGRLLVFDCHEAWVYQLRAVNRPLDIIVGLAGRATRHWDTSMRPVPANARCVRLSDVLAACEQYDCIIHGTLGGMIFDQQTTTPPDDLRRALSQYVRMIGAHVVAVSHLKGRSWGLDEDVVPLSADPADYPSHSGDLARGLRVANQIRGKLHTLKWDFHEKAFGGLPLTLVGRNDDMPAVNPARDWNNLKEIFRRHRFFVHTAEPSLEDGYNMATLEAMAAGLPVLGNCHPTSPIRNGVNGFLSDDPAELRMFAWQLIRDSDLAKRLGAEARKTVTTLFSAEKFRSGIVRSIETARKKWTEFHCSTPARHAEI